VRRLLSGIYYLKINAFRPPVQDQFENALSDLRGASGVIVDLRGNSGGDIHDVGLKIADRFFSRRVSFGRFINRSGGTPFFHSFTAGGAVAALGGPVVLLIDEGTRSAAEIFANAFQESGRGKVVGLQSCGCVADAASKRVKGGGTLQYSHLGYLSETGRRLEGVGVVPDKIVALTLEAVRHGRDTALEEAQRGIASP
jgi:carboxyl-terminal processing protease